MAQLKRILIVEDEAPIAKALALKLNSSGFEAVVAGDGDVALELLAGKQFDLVLLDLVMPRRDGFGVLQEMKVRNIATPVIVLSNLGQDGDVTRAMALGAESYFIKSDTALSSIVLSIAKKFSGTP